MGGGKSASLAASLSATVAGRARYFEDLSRRRVLRLGIEADLREARAKLDILLASVPPALQRLDPEKGDQELAAGRSEEKEGKVGRQPRHDDKSDDATQEDAGGEGRGKANRTPKHQQDAFRRPETHISSTKKSEGFGPRAKGGGKGSQQQSGRGEGRSRGNDVVVACTPVAPSANKRRCRGAKEPATMHREPQEAIVKGRRPSVEDTKTATEPALINRKKKSGPPNRRQTPIAAKEKDSKQGENSNDTTNEDDNDSESTVVEDRKKVASPVEGELQKQEGPGTTGCGEETHEKRIQAGNERVAEAFTAEHPCGTAGEEAPLDQRSGETGGKTVAKTGVESKTKSPPNTSLKHERSPRPSPRRPKGVSSPPPAQFRKPPKSPREGLTNDGGPTDQSKPKTVPTIKNVGDVGADDPVGHGHLQATSNASGEEGGTNETATDAAESPRQGEVADAPDDAEERDNTSAQKKAAERRTKVGTKLPRGQATRGPVALRPATRSPGKAAKTKPALRAARTPPTRLGITTKAKRALVEKNGGKDAAGSTSERAPPELVDAGGVAEDAERSEEPETENPLRDSTQEDRAVGDEGAEEGGAARSNVADEENGDVPTVTESTQNEIVCLEMHHAPTAMPLQDAEPVEGDCDGSWGGEEERKKSKGGDDHVLPRDAADLTEALRVEVDRLRLERAELEDTVAQLNVAAAQLYFVEYEHMKVCVIALVICSTRKTACRGQQQAVARGFSECTVK